MKAELIRAKNSKQLYFLLYFLNATSNFMVQFKGTERRMHRLTISAKHLALFSTVYPDGTDEYGYPIFKINKNLY